MNLLKYITKTASCPAFGDWAIAKHLNVNKKSGAVGDIVLFDFNRNGTSDHIGIITGVIPGGYTTIEGNTSLHGSQDNGGAVCKQTRTYSQINYCVKVPYESEEQKKAVLARAYAELGYMESPKDSNNTKYGIWCGANYQPWCCSFVCWLFAHAGVEPEVIPDYPTETLKEGSKGVQVKSLQICLNTILKSGLTVDGEFGAKTDAAVKVFQKKYGLTEDGIVGPKTIAMLKNPVIPVQTNVPTAKIGKAVDVSYWQHSIDWVKAAADGVTHAVCRASYTSQDKFSLNGDSTFVKNVEGAYAAGVKVGAYHYSQAISEAEAKKEAEYIVKILEPYKSKITLPVVLDWEFGKRLNASKAKALGKTKCTAICKAFCDVVSAAGYTPMVYANYTAFKNYLILSEIRKFSKVWLAQYNSTKSIVEVDWWQYTSSGSVKGITGKVDMNKIYEPAATVQTSGEKIAVKALELAWPKGTASAEYKYPAGAATTAFTQALDKVYSTHKKWGKAPSVGASCDVFAGTVIRSSGIDIGMPRGLDEQFPYFAKSVKWSKIAKPSVDSVQEGDVILYHKTGSGGHICIVVKIGGKLYVAEASYQQNFGHIADSLKTRMSMTGKKDLFVYRAK